MQQFNQTSEEGHPLELSNMMTVLCTRTFDRVGAVKYSKCGGYIEKWNLNLSFILTCFHLNGDLPTWPAAPRGDNTGPRGMKQQEPLPLGASSCRRQSLQ